jgi:histone deacetylase 6
MITSIIYLNLQFHSFTTGYSQSTGIEESKSSTKPKKAKKKGKSKPSGPMSEMRKKAMEEKKKREKEAMDNLKVGYVFEEELSLHKSHLKDHVEWPERIWSIYLHLKKQDLIKNMVKIDGDYATEDSLMLCHKESYLMKIEGKVGMDEEDPLHSKPLRRNKNSYSFNVDTYENKWTTSWAKLATGSVLEVVDALYAQQIKAGFCIVRPPGHHAHTSAASGFWFFNNIAVAARHAQKTHKVEKVCIFDWDVHFGDGTAAIFETDPTVLFVSPHRYQSGKFYPGGSAGSAKSIGLKEGRGFNINIPFDVTGMGNDEYIYICENLVFPIIEEFKPDLLLISAGFDSAEGDPIGGFKLTPPGYAYMTQRLMELWPKVVVVLEGGYNLESIANWSEAVVRVLQGEVLPIEAIGATKNTEEMYMSCKPHDEAKRVVGSVVKNIHKFWRCVEHLVVRSRKTTEEEDELRETIDGLGLLTMNRKTTI